jgi:hypothetical protein
MFLPGRDYPLNPPTDDRCRTSTRPDNDLKWADRMKAELFESRFWNPRTLSAQLIRNAQNPAYQNHEEMSYQEMRLSAAVSRLGFRG